MSTQSPADKARTSRRSNWVKWIKAASGDFGTEFARLSEKLRAEIERHKPVPIVIEHLRVCGVVPESYGPSSKAEKLYSKYTDAVISAAFEAMGLRSSVLSERGDAADVEAFGNAFSFAADAKAFRISRTAKNQKDFKIQSMDGWKDGKPYALVVAPLFQLPARSSQIYEQAAQRNVAILSYSHLAVMVKLSVTASQADAETALHNVFKAVKSMNMNPSKDAHTYWQLVNEAMLGLDQKRHDLWATEKTETEQALAAAMSAAKRVLNSKLREIKQLSHKAAIAQLLSKSKTEKKMTTVQQFSMNNLFDAK